MTVEVVRTRHGALAVRDVDTGEVMHPVIGPRAEADALYVEASRLVERLCATDASRSLVLLDVGLGAGSNAGAALRARASLAHARKLEVVSFDRTLEAMSAALASGDTDAFGFDERGAEAARTVLGGGTFDSAWASWRFVGGDLPGTLEAEPSAVADIVFWDPFSPRANPELWTTRAFSAVRRLCREGATLHTYSRATAVRSAMLLAGFAVGTGDATGEKEDTTIAAVGHTHLARPLDRRWLERLARSSAPFPSDAPPDAMDRIRACAQFR